MYMYLMKQSMYNPCLRGERYIRTTVPRLPLRREIQRGILEHMEILFSYHEGKSYKYLIGCVCIVLCGLLALAPYGSVLYAGEAGLSLTIAPPLIQINLQPGETWNSSISVVNNNAY